MLKTEAVNIFIFVLGDRFYVKELVNCKQNPANNTEWHMPDPYRRRVRTVCSMYSVMVKCLFVFNLCDCLIMFQLFPSLNLRVCVCVLKKCHSALEE